MCGQQLKDYCEFIIGNLPTERSEKFPRMIGNNSHHTRQSQCLCAD